MNPMEMVVKQAFAKLNLTLAVLYKRADGYHALESLMQSVTLADTVSVRRARDVTVTASGMTLPYNNTLARAAEGYRRLTRAGANIHVAKRIPAEAGLGGGSADAAAVLAAMDELYGELDETALTEIALSVGADVPFCLFAERGAGLALARGVGEALTPLCQKRKLYFVLAKPKAGVSTRALFTALTLPRENPDTMAALRAVEQGDVSALGSALGNALQGPAEALVPEIAVLCEKLRAAGALGACMTGSGSAVFGLFDTTEAAESALPAVSSAAFSCVAESR